MNNFVFNFRGCFGSGKSVVPSMLVHSVSEGEKEVVMRPPPSNKKVSHIILHPPKIVVVGGYDKSCGGIDTFVPFSKAVEAVHAAAEDAARLGYDLIMEGVILSSTLSGSVRLFQELEEKHGFGIVPMYLNTPVARCESNIQHRNGGKAIKGDTVSRKHNSVWTNQRPKMREFYKVYIFRTEDVDTQGMLERFQRLRKKLKGE